MVTYIYNVVNVFIDNKTKYFVQTTCICYADMVNCLCKLKKLVFAKEIYNES